MIERLAHTNKLDHQIPRGHQPRNTQSPKTVSKTMGRTSQLTLPLAKAYFPIPASDKPFATAPDSKIDAESKRRRMKPLRQGNELPNNIMAGSFTWINGLFNLTV
jgi:hypothetical protein